MLPRRLEHTLPLLALIALALVAYANSFHAAFVFDDLDGITSNPLVWDLSNYVPFGRGYRADPNRYLGNLSFALNHRLGGLEPFGFHVVNLCIHVANAGLVALLVRVSFRTPVLAPSRLASFAGPIAWLAAALFVAHPIQTQAVTYIVQRFASLATTFYLSAVVGYLAWRCRREAGAARGLRGLLAYALVLLAAVAAMRTKQIAFTLPFAILVAERLLFGPLERRRAIALVPLFATAALIPLGLLDLEKPLSAVLSDADGATRIQTSTSRLEYLVTQAPVVATYLRLLVFPVGQNADWDFPTYRSVLDPAVAGSLILLSAIAAIAVILILRSRRRGGAATLDPAARLIALGIVWFFLTLAVESSVIPIVDVMFEHRVYLPSAGFFIAVATAMVWAGQGLLRGRTRGIAAAAAGILVLVLAGASAARNEVWHDDVALWSDVVAKSPRSARARLNLGKALVEQGQVAAAIPHYLQGLEIAPANPRIRNNLGVALYKVGRVDDAIVQLEAAVALQPGYAEAHNNLGIAFGKKGWYEQAAREIAAGARFRDARR